MLNCSALSRISAPQESCIKRWKFSRRKPRNKQKYMKFMASYLLSPANSTENVKRSSIIPSCTKGCFFFCFSHFHLFIYLFVCGCMV